jgi:hypothetical protein
LGVIPDLLIFDYDGSVLGGFFALAGAGTAFARQGCSKRSYRNEPEGVSSTRTFSETHKRVKERREEMMSHACSAELPYPQTAPGFVSGRTPHALRLQGLTRERKRFSSEPILVFLMRLRRLPFRHRETESGVVQLLFKCFDQFPKAGAARFHVVRGVTIAVQLGRRTASFRDFLSRQRSETIEHQM